MSFWFFRNLTLLQDVPAELFSCLLSNISICTSQDAEKFVVLVYNPLAWNVTHYIRLPTNDTNVVVYGPNGKKIFNVISSRLIFFLFSGVEQCDIVPTFGNFGFVKLSKQPSPHEIVFSAKDVPALGFRLYHVDKTSNGTKCKIVATTNSTTFGSKVNTLNISVALYSSYVTAGKITSVTITRIVKYLAKTIHTS